MQGAIHRAFFLIATTLCGLLISKSFDPRITGGGDTDSQALDISFLVSPPKTRTITATERSGNNHQRRYLKYDEAGIKPIAGTARSHRLYNAVPETRTIPRAMAENKTYHLSQRRNTSHISILKPFKKYGGYNWEHHSYETDYRTLYYYNPAILPLHNTIPASIVGDNPTYDDDDPDLLSKEDLLDLSGGDANVRYVATYQSYTGSNCFGPDPERALMKAGEQIFYLMVALLDENLDIIPGTDVMVDLNAGPGYGKYYRQWKGDCRIFLVRGSIYLSCDENILRVRIKRRQKDDEAHYTINTTKFGTANDTRLPYIYPAIYGNGLEITLLAIKHKIEAGKNFNIFRSLALPNQTSTNTGLYDYYLQTYPLPHKYRRLKFPSRDELSQGPKGWGKAQNSTASLPIPSFDTPDTNKTIVSCGFEEGRPGEIKSDGDNCTQPREFPFFAERDHGTACCVSLKLDGKEVMVGISHVKLSNKNKRWKKDKYHRYDHLLKDQYVSRFVAYDPRPPFDIVARSGWWCLGFADENERGGNTLAGLNTKYRLNLFNETFDCPPIQFPSGFSAYVGDPSKAIISYGVNDCYPRVMVVRKSDVERSLKS